MDAAFSSATEKFRFKGGRGQCGQHSGGSSAQGGRGSGGDGSARASNRLHESYPSNCSSAIDTYNGSTCEQEAKVRRSVCLCIVAALSRAFRILWIALEPAKSLPSPAVASRCRHRHCCTAAALDRQLPAPVPCRLPPPPLVHYRTAGWRSMRSTGRCSHSNPKSASSNSSAIGCGDGRVHSGGWLVPPPSSPASASSLSPRPLPCRYRATATARWRWPGSWWPRAARDAPCWRSSAGRCRSSSWPSSRPGCSTSRKWWVGGGWGCGLGEVCLVCGFALAVFPSGRHQGGKPDSVPLLPPPSPAATAAAEHRGRQVAAAPVCGAEGGQQRLEGSAKGEREGCRGQQLKASESRCFA